MEEDMTQGFYIALFEERNRWNAMNLVKSATHHLKKQLKLPLKQFLIYYAFVYHTKCW